MRWILYGAVLFSLLCASAACSSKAAEKQDSKLLARVHNKKLYLSAMEGMFPAGTTPEDSALIINAYTQRWLRETLIMHEAEQHIPGDLNIDKLVRDYRASLIRHNYEVALMEQRLDSVIARSELTDFYEKNKDQYQLETPIVRCLFLKIPLASPGIDQVRQWWNKSGDAANMAKLVTYCNRYAAQHILDASAWHDVEDIAAGLPAGTITADNIGAKREFTQQDDNFQYYFRLFEMKNRRDIAPFTYIEGQARKFILHNRKLKLLEDIKEELYEREARRDNIELFLQ